MTHIETIYPSVENPGVRPGTATVYEKVVPIDIIISYFSTQVAGMLRNNNEN
jgi:hypothetical protein